MAVTIERWMAQGLPVSIAKELFDNFGGRFSVDVSTGHIVTIPDEVRYVYHVLTGALAHDVTYTFPVIGAFYFVENATSGAFNVTVQVLGGNGLVVPAGTLVFLLVDAIAPSLTSIVATGSPTTAYRTLSFLSSSKTVVSGDQLGTIGLDASAGAFDLQFVHTLTGIKVDLIKLDSSTNVITVKDGSTVVKLISTQFQTARILATGSQTLDITGP